MTRWISAVAPAPPLVIVMSERDITERLRFGFAGACAPPLADEVADMEALMEKAADEIDRLRARCAELEKALGPFALVAERDIGDSEADEDLWFPMKQYNRAPPIRVADLRFARATLQGQDNDVA